MSLLHSPSIERLQTIQIDGAALLHTFEALAKQAELENEDTMDLVIHCLAKDDKFVPNTYVPEIHFIIRKVGD